MKTFQFSVKEPALTNLIKKMNYFPQDLVKIHKIAKNSKRSGTDTIGNRPSRSEDYIQEFTGYPKNILEIPHDTHTFHPTQKPVALFEYLIRTYTNEGDTVMDNCLGSGTTAIAAENTGRRWIGIERDPTYFGLACDRIARHLA